MLNICLSAAEAVEAVAEGFPHRILILVVAVEAVMLSLMLAAPS
jgi:hypothetical protein